MKKVQKIIAWLLVMVMCMPMLSMTKGIAADVNEVKSKDWTFYGAAYFDSSSDSYILTPDSPWKEGIMWLNEQIYSDFTLSLDYYSGIKGGADGLSVIFFNDSRFQKLDISPDIMGFAVDIDTYYNGKTEPTKKIIFQ